MDFLKMLFGEGMGKGAGGILGSDAFKNLAGLGTNLWQGMQQNDMMKKQFGLANKAFGMQQDIFNENKKDREHRRNLDFTLS